MRGQRETIGSVVAVTRRAGASCSFEQLPGGHIAAVVGFNGRTRKVILSSTTHDRNERHIAKRYTRRVLRALGAVS
jgi:poly(3-hydroxyalkanoate) synthetase